MTKEIKNKYFKTKNYSMFKKVRGNRDVDPLHVARIVKLIAQRDTKNPIIVNKKMEVLDGQHTLEARKQLGLDVYYLISDSTDATDVAAMNTGNRNWGLKNHLDMHCDRGKSDYQIVRSKMVQFKTPIAETIALMMRRAQVTNEVTNDFRLGKFKIPAGGIAYFDKVAKELVQIAKSVDPDAKKIKRQLIRAYMIISKHKDWNFERLKAAMKSKGGKLSAVTSRDEYIEQIEKIYNGGLVRSKKIDLVRFAKDKSYEEAA